MGRHPNSPGPWLKCKSSKLNHDSDNYVIKHNYVFVIFSDIGIPVYLVLNYWFLNIFCTCELKMHSLSRVITLLILLLSVDLEMWSFAEDSSASSDSHLCIVGVV